MDAEFCVYLPYWWNVGDIPDSLLRFQPGYVGDRAGYLLCMSNLLSWWRLTRCFKTAWGSQKAKEKVREKTRGRKAAKAKGRPKTMALSQSALQCSQAAWASDPCLECGLFVFVMRVGYVCWGAVVLRETCFACSFCVQPLVSIVQMCSGLSSRSCPGSSLYLGSCNRLFIGSGTGLMVD